MSLCSAVKHFRVSFIPLHNALFVQSVFLQTKQAETYLKIYVLMYYLKYVCPSLFGWKEYIILRQPWSLNSKFAIYGLFWPILIADLIYVSNITNIINGEKIVMWRIFSFPCMAIVGKSKTSPQQFKFFHMIDVEKSEILHI